MLKNRENTAKTARKLGKILGINVLSTSISEVLAGVENFISHSSALGNRNHKFFILTPNPELVLMAQDNTDLKEALNAADFPIPDGVGLRVAIPSLPIIKGREVFVDLIKLARKKIWKVFLLGGLGGEAELAAQKIEGVVIQSFQGPILNNSAEPITKTDQTLEKEAIQKINAFKPHILFVAFGNPKQEIWIHKNLSKLNIGGAMAVGGTLRYVAGLSKLPPKWMERFGLEWLFRLITEPWRSGRIFKASIIFPLKVFGFKIGH